LMALNVFALGAHADDVEVMCGGALALHKSRGDRVVALILCSKYPLQADVTSEARTMEAKEGGRRLHVDEVNFGGLTDGSVSDSVETIKLVESYMHRDKPEVIYIPSDKDRHQDHRSAARAAQSAARYARKVLSCETPSASLNFNPTFFVDISQTFETKIYALKAYQSQFNGHSVDLNTVEAFARFRGTQAGTKFAEAFEPIRYLI